jgi:hypothetical protein
MSDEILHRGFRIRAEPYQLQGGGWLLEGVLIETGNPHPRHLRFYLGGTTNSREAAVEMVHAEGRRLIDLRSKEKAPPP